MVSIGPTSCKSLRFSWTGQLYEFVCLPFGINVALWLFTKLMKPVMGYLRSQGWLSTIHLDDLLLFGESKTACKPNVKVTEELFSSLGLVINTKKSCLISRKVASFWGGRVIVACCSLIINMVRLIPRVLNIASSKLYVITIMIMTRPCTFYSICKVSFVGGNLGLEQRLIL